MRYDHYDRYGRTKYDKEDSLWICMVGMSLGALIGILVGLAM